MKFILSMYDKMVVDCLKLVVLMLFVCIMYMEVIEILEKVRILKCGVFLNGCGCG